MLRQFIIVVALLTLGTADQPAALPTGITLEEAATGFDQPLTLTHAGDERLFVVEKTGAIRIINADGSVRPTPFLEIDVSTEVERGLLGLVFHPDDPSTFFVNYTRQPDGATVIARYTVSASDPNLADPTSEEVLLIVEQPEANHNAGQLAFGPDGYLWVGLGDGGGSGDPENHGQNLSTLLGTLLRIDVDGGTPYTVPADNPFVGDPDARDEIWAYGLRNPWRFSFDRLTGDLYIADVGQNLYEEINFAPASSSGSENYGWRLMEATHCFNPATDCNPGDLTLPVIEYDHSNSNRSVTGGYVYRGEDYPALGGVYFYADYISGRIWATSLGSDWATNEVLDTNMLISAFGEDVNGELYVLDIGEGAVHRVKPADGPPAVPDLLSPAADAAVTTPTPTFTWQQDPDVSRYLFGMGTDGPLTLLHIGRAVTCDGQTCSYTLPEGVLTGDGSFAWGVRAIGAGGFIDAQQGFISALEPGPFAVLTPENGTTLPALGAITWEADERVTSYTVYAGIPPNTPLASAQLTPSAVCETGICSYTFDGLTLEAGREYGVLIRAENDYGRARAWSIFTLSAAHPK